MNAGGGLLYRRSEKARLEIRQIERGHIVNRKGRREEKKGNKRMNERAKKNRGNG